ncbi:hypothetical protein LDL08_33700 [Nonomuraea glycinis]|uniref:Uncharacterized protein n=1 Tax=Nonomuraea glycinis TaxID=2047744 RepID=A0A918AE49_9ACTN|nr:hypothetical protein [Nonomuraea glycinis]MCA2181143.1 hypothetical protein [Nonomuraea glycinis]GGP13577.1 hypothetical protein GCM10012278_65900 [Nonomuraea glycinis]
MIPWAAALIAILMAAMPVTREQLTRFAELTGLSVTETNARRIVAHFADLRRWRLVALVLTAPLTGLTNDPSYLVLGWCAVSVFRDVRLPARVLHMRDDMTMYRGAWLLGLLGAVVAGGYALDNQGVTPAFLAHAVIGIVVAAAVPLAARKLSAVPEPSDDIARAELALDHWSSRALYLSGTAIVLSSALLAPWQPPKDDAHEYTMPMTFSEGMAAFTTVDAYKEPTCAWVDQVDAPCRSWRVNGEPFPQAAPYVIRKGGAPQAAPFARSPDKKAVVYLTRRDRRMVYQDAAVVHPLTGSLADSALPTVTFHGQSRYVALARDGATITDTKTWATTSIPGVRRVHDLNASGIVATTATQVLVVDHRGTTRLSLPFGNASDLYDLRADGRKLAIIQGGSRVDTFTVATGEKVSSVVPRFPGDDYVEVSLGWSENNRLLVRGGLTEHVYEVNLATGELRRHRK